MLLLGILIFVGKKTNAQQPFYSHLAWQANNPFVNDVFIENQGQFYKQEQADVGEKILYATKKGKLYLYFTHTMLVFRYDSVYKITDTDSGGDKDEEIKDLRIRHVFLYMKWAGANSNTDVEAQNEVPDYYTYNNPKDKTGHSGITAHAWKKLIYHNLYNGIDAEFFFPDDSSKGGIEYTLIVHPGADVSKVKMLYTGVYAALKLLNNNVYISSACANLTDDAPTAKDDAGNTIGAFFSVNNDTVSFKTQHYDNTRTLTIDPWIHSTSLGGVNKVFDLDYDINGNVYVYGGGSSTAYELQKYSNTGILQWTYTTPFTYTYSSAYFYGGFATDEHNGNSYIVEGYDAGAGNQLVKVNPSGAQIATYTGNPGEDECWRLAYDYCYNEIIIGAGSNTTALQSAHIDTALTTLTAFNAYTAAAQGHDVCLIAQDYGGKAYMATARSAPGTVPGVLDNVMCQLPLPACTPTAYQVPDRHIFIEITNVSYYPLVGTYAAGNGFNGMAADPEMVVTYDGASLKKWRASNGTFLDSVSVSPTSFAWGGCDLDCGAKIYLGNNTSIDVYDSNLALVSAIPGLVNTDVIYALKVFSARNQVYTAGNGFVRATNIAVSCGPPLPCAIVLPIRLNYFTCQSAANGITLSWSTATETNNKYFTISRSSDGVNFVPIATLPGAGNSTIPLYYSYTDDNPSLNGSYYYRLSQTDFDGHTVSFNITSCTITMQAGNVYPNPSTGKFSISTNNAVEEIQVYNALGQKIYDKHLPQNLGNVAEIDLSSRPAGVYLLKMIKANLATAVKKLIIYPK